MTNSDKILLTLTLLGVGGITFYLLSKSAKKLSAQMLYPVRTVITAPYGDRISPTTNLPEFHNGIDLRAGVGDPIISPADGIVTSQYSNTAGGNQMLIKHTNGYTSGYAHLSAYLVTEGEAVKQGQEIAYAGDTGVVTAAHLHFTLRDQDGNLVNPETYLS
jgi:murein DD-endopeptidase MepM/ murein hydrolase activator NlpD